MVARAGITGEQEADPSAALADRVRKLRDATDLPIACGFGISTPRHVGLVVAHADAAIVGSALVKRLGTAAEAGEDPASVAGAFTGELTSGLADGAAAGA
jgi:tryptophan synthase alpha chain